MLVDTDVVVVGSGCFGSLAALVARRLGLRVCLIERGRHPRFAIGESSTPLANLLVEEIARQFGLPELAPLAKWGTWKRAYPELRCGKKRGFTFLSNDAGGARTDDGMLMVAASPHDEIADTHWHRADLDAFLYGLAERAGVRALDRTTVRSIEVGGAGCVLGCTTDAGELEVRAQLLVDASGPRGLLHRHLSLPEARFDDLPQNSALFSHFRNVRLLEGSAFLPAAGGLPYPPDAAAVHHILPGGWVWVLTFDEGTVSAGVAATPALAAELDFSDPERAWRRLLALSPALDWQLGGAERLLPFHTLTPMPFRTEAAAGDGWLMMPSAAAVIDPLLSTGFPLSLLGVLRLGRALQHAGGDLRTPAFRGDCQAIARQSLGESDRAALLVAALYHSFGDFELFRALARLYFAAVIFAETRIRLGKRDPGAPFLCADHATFGPDLERVCRQALTRAARHPPGRGELLTQIAAAMAPIDVAGLARPERAALVPADPADLYAATGKLQATTSEIAAMLRRCGCFVPPPSSIRRGADLRSGLTRA